MLFIEWKGYMIYNNVLYHDNKSAIILEVGGKRNACKIILALDIHYFLVADQVKKENVQIKY